MLYLFATFAFSPFAIFAIPFSIAKDEENTLGLRDPARHQAVCGT
jgi:hypothetical protein